MTDHFILTKTRYSSSSLFISRCCCLRMMTASVFHLNLNRLLHLTPPLQHENIPSILLTRPCCYRNPSKTYAPHCLSGVQYLCGYIVATHTLQPCMHWHGHDHLIHTHTHTYAHAQTSTTTVTSHTFLLFIYIINTVSLLCIHSVSVCIFPEMMCIFMHMNWV